MKKFIYIFLLISIFFINYYKTEAYLITCSYDNDIDAKIRENSGKNTEGYRMYLELDGTRRLLWLDDPTGTKTAAQHAYDTKNPFSLVDPRDKFKDSSSSLFKFSTSYNSLYLSLYDSGAHDLNAYAFWLNIAPTNITEKDPQLFKWDVKKSYVEGGKCPTYVCACVSDTTTTSSAFIFYGGISGEGEYANEGELKTHCESLKQSPLALNNCEFKELRYDMLDKVNITAKEKIIHKELFNLTENEMKELINLLDFRMDPNKTSSNDADRPNLIPGIDKTVTSVELTVLTQFYDYKMGMINDNDKDAIMSMVNNIVENPNKFNGVGGSVETTYKKLVQVAKAYKKFHDTDISSLYTNAKEMSCDSLFGDPSDKKSFAYYLNLILSVIQWAGPVLVVILVTFDYFKALVEKNPDVLKKTNTRTMIRIILVFILFYVPFFVKFILTTFGIQEYCNLS